MSYYILSFCGGGIRGLISAALLNKVASDFYSETKINILEKVNMVAGTSAGAIVSGLIADNANTKDILLFFHKIMPKALLNPGTDPSMPAFGGDVIKNIAAETAFNKNKPLSYYSKQIVLTSFNIGNPVNQGNKGTPWFAFLNSNLPGSQTASTNLIDAVFQSGSMPGMSAPFQNTMDGAFAAHDPTLAAVAGAVQMGHKLEDITVLDFGTGFFPNWLGTDAANWGVEQFLNGVPNDGSQLSSLLVNMENTTPQVSPVLNMLLNGSSTSFTPDLAKMLLGDRFAYLNPELPTLYSEIDTNSDNLNSMIEIAEKFDTSAAMNVLNTYWVES